MFWYLSEKPKLSGAIAKRQCARERPSKPRDLWTGHSQPSQRPRVKQKQMHQHNRAQKHPYPKLASRLKGHEGKVCDCSYCTGMNRILSYQQFVSNSLSSERLTNGCRNACNIDLFCGHVAGMSPPAMYLFRSYNITHRHYCDDAELNRCHKSK